MSDTDIVVRNQFTNQNSPGHANSHVKSFVMNYMLRDDAVEPLVVDDEQQRQYVEILSQLSTPDDQDAVGILNHKLHYAGIGFDRDNLSLSRKEQEQRASQAQAAYDRGGTVKQTVISFDSQWLKDQGVLDKEVQLPPLRGELHGHVDQRQLRQAVQDGLNEMFAQTTMHDPQYVGAIQTDTAHVHVHLAIWDQDQKVKDDRGMINGKQKQSLRYGISQSLEQQEKHLDNTQALQTLAQVTQQNARLKRQQLEHNLYESAIRLDQQSLDEYVHHLADFDQRTLSQRQRDHVEQQIRQDWQARGKLTKRSHTLSQGQRRSRRQLRAMKEATILKQELRQYNKANANLAANQQSRPVKQALAFEYRHQLGIVEKYRMYQRPRVDAIYQNRKPELDRRRDDLLQQRRTVLHDLGSQGLRPHYVQRLLERPGVMQGLSDQDRVQGFDRPLSQNPAYQELRLAQDDPHYPLSEPTLKAVSKALPQEEDPERVDQNLRRNQHIEQNNLSGAQRIALAEYLAQLDEYEMDAVSWGGLSYHQLDLARDENQLPEPLETTSIYERPLGRQDDALLAIDAHQASVSGQLKPQIELAMREELTTRFQHLTKAHGYFAGTGQQDPRWLQDAQRDLNRQYNLLNQQSSTTGQEPMSLKTQQPVKQEVEGYELSTEQQADLVNDHLREVNDLER